MTPLRQRFIDDLKLAGYSQRTIESYVYSISRLAQHCNKSPQLISNEELRQYLLYHKDKYASNTTTMALCAIKHLFGKTLKRTMPVFNLTRQKKKNKLPSVLSKEEVRYLLKKVKLLRYRALFTIIYCCGLRLNEALNLKVNNIDSKRMTLKVDDGKGGTDRYTPLPETGLEILRKHYKTHRNPLLIFPKCGQQQNEEPTAKEHLRKSTVWVVFKKVVTECNFNKEIHPHTLRHSYATHLLEDGVDIRVISEYLGHKSLETTLIYTHLTPLLKENTYDKINQLMNDLR
jgi:site-specific recombinase XerD